MTRCGLFVGLVTLDLIYLAKDLPGVNQKIVALDYAMAAGGPATNAAVAFRHLGNTANLLGVLGSHPIKQLVLADLEQWNVTVTDLNPASADPLPTSSIIVNQSTGDRAAISLNALRSEGSVNQIPSTILQGVNVVLIDGHQMPVGRAIAQEANLKKIPVVIDGGSWKQGFEQILSKANYAICSSSFQPPGCQTPAEVFAYLSGLGIRYIAITNDGQPIQYFNEGKTGNIHVPSIRPVDTLGAGDIFHGAFCHFILQSSFRKALMDSAEIASRACRFFGTRRWMED
jgi:sugar/nucleoside kinase (ribokinase family)